MKNLRYEMYRMKIKKGKGHKSRPLPYLKILVPDLVKALVKAAKSRRFVFINVKDCKQFGDGE